MKILGLFRHAKSDWHDPRARDFDRPLNERGRKGAAVMAEAEITIRIELGRGDCSETIWTTDLSHEYVKINAEYRT